MRCEPDEHDWMVRGADADSWRECFLCGEEEDIPAVEPTEAQQGCCVAHRQAC